ncbi:MAG: biotin/lipoyl-binding protein, partial [Bradyrhizobium sp.]|nr:biotin/lipoyl-binding protein [Bradyrhizobium sp.]
MSRHDTAFQPADKVPAEAVQQLLPDHTEVTTVPAPQGRSVKESFRKLLLASAAVAVLAGASWYGYDYWTVGRYLVSTDDAYVKADNTTIAPRVSGYLTDVKVGDNERVAAGQVLARI